MTAEEAFKRLGLRPGVSPRTVRTMYIRSAQDVHPDKGGDATAFNNLQQAYQAALDYAEKEVCPECYGSGTVLRMLGWKTHYIECTTCVGHTGRRW